MSARASSWAGRARPGTWRSSASRGGRSTGTGSCVRCAPRGRLERRRARRARPARAVGAGSGAPYAPLGGPAAVVPLVERLAAERPATASSRGGERQLILDRPPERSMKGPMTARPGAPGDERSETPRQWCSARPRRSPARPMSTCAPMTNSRATGRSGRARPAVPDEAVPARLAVRLLRQRRQRVRGGRGPVLTGFWVSPLGPDCDECGDQPLAEIARVRVAGLPPERDLYSKPRRLSEIEPHLARHGSGP
jgi:hypothetical protein